MEDRASTSGVRSVHRAVCRVKPAGQPSSASRAAAYSARQGEPLDLSGAVQSHGAPVVLLRDEEVAAYSEPFLELTGINPSHPLDLEALLACLFADATSLRTVLGALREQRRGAAALTPIKALAQLPAGPRHVELTAGTGPCWMLSVRAAEEPLDAELRAVLPGCAHDLNNVLTILAFSPEDLPAASPARRAAMAERRNKQLDHGRDLIRALAALSRSESEPEELPPGPLLAQFCETFGRSISGLSLRLSDAPPVGRVRVDRVLLDRILLNLLINARDAAAPERVTVTLSQALWGAERVRAATGGELERPCACIAVSDDGPGVPEALRHRVFERSFTTRGSQGLGLATVRQLMALHRGAVLLDEHPGPGATFRLLFPTC